MAGPSRVSKIKPKRWHGYAIVLFILGSLFPPLAVAARFGLGKDFWINLFLTLCGYFPGHAHNFYIQNIRNNKNARRTPKWAVRYGLIDDTALKRRAKRREWAVRYNDRLPQSALEGQAVEEGQIADPVVTPTERRNDDLWSARDEAPFYGQPDAASSEPASVSTGSGRWHYPANFEDTEPPSPVTPKTSKSRVGKKEKKDRWARTEEAYAAAPKKRKSKASLGKSSRHKDGGTDSVAPYSESPEESMGARPTSSILDERRRSGDELNHQF